MYKRKFFAFEIKSLDDKGSFSGYGSVYGNVDLKGDVMQPGVFAKSLAAKAENGKVVPVLWQHKSDTPIGKYTKLAEDGKGLYTEGQLSISGPYASQQAKEAYGFMKDGVITGQSVGYNTKDEEYDPKGGVWNVKEADLWECSIVTFPANTDAMIDQVKHAIEHGTMPTVRFFENFLREAGYSKAVALEIASKGYAPILRRRESEEQASGGTGESPGQLDSVLELIANKSFSIK
jgi:uncharacterized protein